MAITLKTDKRGLAIVDRARKRKNWIALASAWCDAANVSVSTLKRFRERKAIQKDSFISICSAVGIEDWASIACDADFYSAGVQPKTQGVKELISEEISANIVNLDARLEFLNASPYLEEATQGMGKTRASSAVPVPSQIANLGYRQLTLRQDTTSKSTPDQFEKDTASTASNCFCNVPFQVTAKASLLQDILQSGLEPHLIRDFYRHLSDVQTVSESLFGKLSELTSQVQVVEQLGDPERPAKHSTALHRDRRRLQKHADLDRSDFDHSDFNHSGCEPVTGLLVSDTLTLAPPEPNVSWDSFVSQRTDYGKNNGEKSAAVERGVVEQMSEILHLLDRKTELVEEGEVLLEKTLETYQKNSLELEIKPTDPWGEVVGKAIALRQQGRTTDALAAFAKYGEMFATEDPTAPQYAETARQFTLHMRALGLEGGLYIYELLEDGTAMRAGIPAGSIAIACGGRSIQSLEDWVEAQKVMPLGEPCRITYLTADLTANLSADRRNPFVRKTQRILGGPIGAGLMPI